MANYIPENILEHRVRAIDEMLRCCYSYMGEFMNMFRDDPRKYACKHRDPFTGSGPEVAEACEALTFGSFVLALRSIGQQEVGVHLTRQKATDVFDSFERMEGCFQKMAIRNLGKTPRALNNRGHCDHSQCTSELIRDLRDIPKNAEHLLNPVDASHRSHMEQRRRELGQTAQSDLENHDQHCWNSRKRRRQ